MKINHRKFFQVSVLGISLLISNLTLAQNKTLDPGNMRAGENVEYCGTHKKMAELMNNPAFATQFAIDQQLLANAEQTSTPRGVVYTIPIVFHVLHNGGDENISDAQIFDALRILNRDYRLQNTDAATVHSDFNASNPSAFAVPSDVEIEFVMATKAPNGACFNGITRTQSSLTEPGDDGQAQVNAIVAGNNIAPGSQWAGNKYLNVFICKNIGGAAGYTTNPSNWSGTSMYNGIWVLANYVGSIGTSSENTSRTLTHEVGHWLNLSHTWGGNNNPGNASSCSSDDGVSDTPNCIGLTSCNLNANTCTDNGIWGQDVRDNAENYMDYSYCSKMFTQGQVDRMRNAITSSVGSRNNIWKPANLTAVGADGNTYLCKADFTANQTTVCIGSQVSFSDISYNEASNWNWTFTGGIPATSTSQNPTITYNTPGTYAVKLVASDGTVSDEENKTTYITVLPAAASLPFTEDFESYATTADMPFSVYSSANNAKWELTNTAGYTGSKSVKLNNFTQSGSNIDELYSSPIDLSDVTAQTGVTMTFRFAYRKKSSSDSELLRVLISDDCGENFVTRKTIVGSSLSNDIETTNWTPTTSDWTTVHMTNITSSYWVENFRYMFRFEGSGGNNIFIDNINVYKGGPESLGLNDLEGMLSELAVYPNPSEGELNLSFNLNSVQNMQVNVLDLTGKKLQSNTIHALEGHNQVLISTAELASGMYLLQLGTNGAAKTVQFVVK